MMASVVFSSGEDILVRFYDTLIDYGNSADTHVISLLIPVSISLFNISGQDLDVEIDESSSGDVEPDLELFVYFS